MKSLIALLIFVFAIFNFSFANAEDGKRFALVIDQVEYSNLAKLDGARDEADQIASSLEKTGFEITRARNLSKDNLFNTLNDFRRKVAKTLGQLLLFIIRGMGRIILGIYPPIIIYWVLMPIYKIHRICQFLA